MGEVLTLKEFFWITVIFYGEIIKTNYTQVKDSFLGLKL